MANAGTLTADGQTDEYQCNNQCTVNLYGTFGSGTATLQRKVNGTWYNVYDKDGTTLSFSVGANASAVVDGTHILRVNLTGSTNPSLNWSFTK